MINKERGRFQVLYCAYVDSPEFSELALEPASVLTHGLLLSGDNNLPGVFPAWRDQIATRAKVRLDQVQPALDELEARDWILREGSLVWVRNRLRFDPFWTPTNPNHVVNLFKVLGTLPRSGLLRNFVRYYQTVRTVNAPHSPYLPPDRVLLKSLPWVERLPPAVLPRLAFDGSGAIVLAGAEHLPKYLLATDLPHHGNGGSNGIPPWDPPMASPHGIGDPVAVAVAVTSTFAQGSTRVDEGRAPRTAAEGLQERPGEEYREPPAAAVGHPARVHARSVTRRRAAEASVSVVWDRWREVMRQGTAVLTSRRRRLIEEQLTAAASPEAGLRDCLNAIEGCAWSGFHMGHERGKEGQVHNGIELILRSRESVEQFGRIREARIRSLGGDPDQRPACGWCHEHFEERELEDCPRCGRRLCSACRASEHWNGGVAPKGSTAAEVLSGIDAGTCRP